MALIIYPLDNYDSFSTVADADTIITNNVPDSVAWLALTESKKEVYLRQATETVKGSVLCLPDTLEEDLKKATAYTANYSITTPTATDSGKGNVKIKEIVDVVKTEYFYATKANSLPDNVVKLLEQYCVVASDSVFCFTRA